MIDYVAPVAVASPCVGVCVIDDATGWCEGCGRTLDEIAGWLAMPASERDAVMAALPQRTQCWTTEHSTEPLPVRRERNQKDMVGAVAAEVLRLR